MALPSMHALSLRTARAPIGAHDDAKLLPPDAKRRAMGEAPSPGAGVLLFGNKDLLNHTSTALYDLPDDLLRIINDKTIYCNGPHFQVDWVKIEDRFMFAIRGFSRGKPSKTVKRIRDALDGYVAALFKEETGLDIVWGHHFSPSEANPTENGTNWVSKTFQSANISFDLCKKWAYLATNSMIRDLGYSLEASSETAPDVNEEWRFQSLHIDFDICTQPSKRLDGIKKAAIKKAAAKKRKAAPPAAPPQGRRKKWAGAALSDSEESDVSE